LLELISFQIILQCFDKLIGGSEAISTVRVHSPIIALEGEALRK